MAVQGSNSMGWSDTYELELTSCLFLDKAPTPAQAFSPGRPWGSPPPPHDWERAGVSSPRRPLARDPGELLMDGRVGGGRSLLAREASMHGKGARHTPAGTAPQPAAPPHPRSALTTMALGLSRSPRSTTPMASPLSRWTLMVLVASHVQNSVRL